MKIILDYEIRLTNKINFVVWSGVRTVISAKCKEAAQKMTNSFDDNFDFFEIKHFITEKTY